VARVDQQRLARRRYEERGVAARRCRR
jgi:hypothetical protein